ncbi:hypothetical protein O181_079225 [Austropuccinia psidii MF-1]|uniref:Uncharacterized protein n=1 Tax=Austropuccinia psidii MF-1 TaxID=1389203 RepID=A0A9Q3FL02_9BASI|nr:hypothetical protein [Austropuccinia psidii MF-1]
MLGEKGNLKQIHEQEDHEIQDMRVRLLKYFVDLQAKKLSNEKLIMKEKNDWDYELERERMDWKFKLDTEEKTCLKHESDCNYKLEKEHMEHNFDLERN